MYAGSSKGAMGINIHVLGLLGANDSFTSQAIVPVGCWTTGLVYKILCQYATVRQVVAIIQNTQLQMPSSDRYDCHVTMPNAVGQQQ